MPHLRIRWVRSQYSADAFSSAPLKFNGKTDFLDPCAVGNWAQGVSARSSMIEHLPFDLDSMSIKSSRLADSNWVQPPCNNGSKKTTELREESASPVNLQRPRIAHPTRQHFPPSSPLLLRSSSHWPFSLPPTPSIPHFEPA